MAAKSRNVSEEGRRVLLFFWFSIFVLSFVISIFYLETLRPDKERLLYSLLKFWAYFIRSLSVWMVIKELCQLLFEKIDKLIEAINKKPI